MNTENYGIGNIPPKSEFEQGNYSALIGAMIFGNLPYSENVEEIFLDEVDSLLTDLGD